MEVLENNSYEYIVLLPLHAATQAPCAKLGKAVMAVFLGLALSQAGPASYKRAASATHLLAARSIPRPRPVSWNVDHEMPSMAPANC